MKMHKFLLIVSLAISQIVNSQSNTWKTNGNNISTGDFLGTTNSQSLIFKTNNQNRMIFDISGNIDMKGFLKADSAEFTGTVKFGNSTGDAFLFFGGFPLPFPQDHLRVTTGFMTITGGGKGGPAPLIGMGINTQTPNDMLDVFSGNIDVMTPNFAYKIGDQEVLWHKDATSNIFVGVGAGSNHTFLTPMANTFLGNDAGFSETGGGGNNTYIGYRAGFSSNGFPANTYVGSQAGENTGPNSDENVFVGYQSGQNNAGFHNTFTGNVSGQNSVGNYNSFYGIGSGQNSATSSDNTYIGSSAGNNGIGSQNAFVGSNSGFLGIGNNNVAIGYNAASAQTAGNQNTYVGDKIAPNMVGGNLNTFLGANADATNPNSTLNNAAALGANAKVTNSNHLILGNNVNVGIGLSGDPLGPLNLLEINTGVANTSGLKFRQLNAASPAGVNPGLGVLALDNIGNVIYVNSSGGASLGNTCGIGTNPLTSNWEIPLNGNNFVFQGQGAVGNNVGIGTGCNPLAKLTVRQQSGIVGSTGIGVRNQDPGNTAAAPTAGIISEVTGGGFSTAGWFDGGNTIGSGWPYGIIIPKGGGGMAIGYNSANLPMGSNVLLEVASQIYAAGIYVGSDKNYKINISNINNGLDKVRKINPVYYNYDTLNYSANNFSSRKQIGFIAQNIDSLIPEAVGKDNSGLLNLDYSRLVPVLWQAVKQLDSLNSQLKNQIKNSDSIQDARLTAIENALNSCCSNNSRLQNPPNNQNTQSINLSDKDIIILNQNVANPFSESTLITYNIPEQYNFAQIIFSTAEGKIIKTVDITKKGHGRLTVFANDLSNGLYTYSLIVDGKTVDTKKMVKSE